MSFLPSAPLIYTLAVVKFPRIPEIERFTDKFFSVIRSAYPHDEKANQATLSAELGQNGLIVKQETKVVWQYLSVNKDCGFILAEDFISFHTNNYLGSTKFLERFKFGLSRLHSIPELALEYVTGMGIRYLDLIAPQNGEPLSKYLAEWVLPRESPIEGIKILEGAYIAKYKTDMGHLSFQAIRNPQSLFPPDLQSAFLQKNGWVRERPQNGEFAIVDTDHFSELASTHAFDVDWIIKRIDELHLIPKNVFASFGTEEAKKLWSRPNAKQ